MYGEVADWSLTVQMLGRVVDLLAQGNWQRGGGKGPKPKPLPRPGGSRRVGSASMTPDELDARLGYSPRS